MRSIALLLFLITTSRTPALAEDWPQFRGPAGQGHSMARSLPLVWNESEHVTWKVPIPGLGWSSPVVSQGQVWLTTATEQGRSLRAIALDQSTGQIIHDVEVFRRQDPGPIHAKNSHASPTPILDEARVYVHYGAYGTACLTRDGNTLWKTQLDYDHRHGPGGSPVLHRDRLIINCDGYEDQFVVALDKHTGRVLWRQGRDGHHAYSTPLEIQVNGKSQVVSTGGKRVVAYDPENGAEIWSLRYTGYSNVPRPVFGHGLVFICSGYDSPSLYSIRPTGSGDVTDSHVVWTLAQAVPHNPSPLLVGDHLYLVSDGGILSCLEARTGGRLWRQRLEGDYSASPVYADGRIYLLNEAGLTTVVAAGARFQRLSLNQLDGRTLASIAIADQAIFLRTDRHLYRIE